MGARGSHGGGAPIDDRRARADRGGLGALQILLDKASATTIGSARTSSPVLFLPPAMVGGGVAHALVA